MTDLRTTRALIAEAEDLLSAAALVKAAGVSEDPARALRMVERLAAALSVFHEREAALFHGRIPEREDPAADAMMRLDVLLRDYRDGDERGWDAEVEHLKAEHAHHLANLTVSIARDGIRVPILLGNDGRVWDGHHRLVVARETGIEWVPVTFTPPRPREDADLDAIEADLADPEVAAYFQTLARGEAEEPGTLSAIGRVTAAAPGLLAHLRTAEAERDEARAKWEAQSRIVVDKLIEGACAVLASRTVETAEEWEYGKPGWPVLASPEGATHRRRPGIPAGPWEPVPPTPEEAGQ